MTRPTAKQILAMSYGSAEQCEAADRWIDRFMPFFRQNGFTEGHVDWLMQAAENTYKRLMFTDVFNLAKRRFNDREYDRIEAERFTDREFKSR